MPLPGGGSGSVSQSVMKKALTPSAPPKVQPHKGTPMYCLREGGPSDSSISGVFLNASHAECLQAL